MTAEYEYRVEFTAHRDLQIMLNKNSAEGWLVETIIPAIEWGICVVIYYKPVTGPS